MRLEQIKVVNSGELPQKARAAAPKAIAPAARAWAPVRVTTPAVPATVAATRSLASVAVVVVRPLSPAQYALTLSPSEAPPL